jgi:hypothetical protein
MLLKSNLRNTNEKNLPNQATSSHHLHFNVDALQVTNLMPVMLHVVPDLEAAQQNSNV